MAESPTPHDMGKLLANLCPSGGGETAYVMKG
jgi:hypothetical protein